MAAVRMRGNWLASSLSITRASLARAVCCCPLFFTPWLHASEGGRTGFSGDPSLNAGATCAVCHAPGGAELPGVSLVGPQTIDAGTTGDFHVVISGGPGQTAGVGISSQDGVGQLLTTDGHLRLLDNQLTHTAPKTLSGGYATFMFRYTAPNYNANVTLHAAGNSSDGSLDLQGDEIGTDTLDITVVNGFEPPPDPPDPPTGELTASLYASGFTQPTVIANAGDQRLFVAERAGTIRIIERDGTKVGTPFLDIVSAVDSTWSEQGLLGLAFHPDYKTNGYFYVYYIHDPGPGRDRSRVSRFSVSSNPDVAVTGSEVVLLEFEQPYTNHNGGDLHFGPDGYLYIASGDGGSGGDPDDNGQDTGNLLGKILRIDVDDTGAEGLGPDCNISGSNRYAIPAGNAFGDGTGGTGCDEIFALGLRNPWRFSFDFTTGAMWVADVGQNEVEEINYLPAGDGGGLNLGWRCYEGGRAFNLEGCSLAYLDPVYTYEQSTLDCSVTGGRVYRGLLDPELAGQYFFTDFCQSSIRALSGNPGNLDYRIALPAGTLSAVSTFGEDYIGEMYVAELNTGNIYRLGTSPTLPPGC